MGLGLGLGFWGRGLGLGWGWGGVQGGVRGWVRLRGLGLEQRLWATWKCGLPMHLAICLKSGAMIFSNSLA